MKQKIFLLSNTKNCDTLIKQTHTKPQEPLDLKKTKQPRKTFSFKPQISIEGCWLISLKSLEVYDSVFNI